MKARGSAWFWVLAGAAAMGRADWPQAGGPERNCVLPGAPVAVPEAGVPPVLWQANVGYGWGPVVVRAGRVYAYGVYRPGTDVAAVADVGSAPTFAEAEQAARDADTAQYHSRDLPGTPTWADDSHGVYRGDGYALCLAADTGTLLWATKLTDWGVILWGNSLVGERSSPAVAEDRVFIHSMTGQLHALSTASGEPLWSVNLFDHGMLRWEEKNGNACSPLVVGATVIVGFHARPDDDYTQPRYNEDGMAVAGFDAATGERRWLTKPRLPGFRTMSSDLGFAVVGGAPTVLVPQGSGTMGLDPATGAVRWTYAARFEDGKDVRFAYPFRMPVAWGDCIVDGVTVAHDDTPSQTWGLRIADGTVEEMWSTHDFVPVAAEFDKANLLAVDGRLYGFDAHGVWDDPMYDGKIDRRAMRRDGRFQCRDIATGRLLWSSDAFNTRKPGEDEYYNPQHLLLAGETLVVTDETGLWLARLTATGVQVLSRVEQVKWRRLQLSPPVLVEGRLFIRQSDASPADGLAPALGAGGNLTCLSLASR